MSLPSAGAVVPMNNLGPSDQQWGKLLDFLSCDREMRTGAFEGPNGKVRLERKWIDAAKEINMMGNAKKSGDKWKEAWDGLKTRAKKAYNARRQYMMGTGGGPCPDLADLGLSHIYQRTIELLDKTSIVGCESVPDPLELQQRGAQNAHQTMHRTQHSPMLPVDLMHNVPGIQLQYAIQPTLQQQPALPSHHRVSEINQYKTQTQHQVVHAIQQQPMMSVQGHMVQVQQFQPQTQQPMQQQQILQGTQQQPPVFLAHHPMSKMQQYQTHGQHQVMNPLQHYQSAVLGEQQMNQMLPLQPQPQQQPTNQLLQPADQVYQPPLRFDHHLLASKKLHTPPFGTSPSARKRLNYADRNEVESVRGGIGDISIQSMPGGLESTNEAIQLLNATISSAVDSLEGFKEELKVDHVTQQSASEQFRSEVSTLCDKMEELKTEISNIAEAHLSAMVSLQSSIDRLCDEVAKFSIGQLEQPLSNFCASVEALAKLS